MIGNGPLVSLDGGQAARTPRPWAEATHAALGGVHGVMTDIDDTLTRDGAIEPAALAALEQLAAGGVPVVAITGRPAGWSEAFARQWPVAAIVAENGAVALIPAAGGLRVEFAQDEPVRRANAGRLRAVAVKVLREVSGATLARDSAGRLTDIAIDHSEFAHLDPADVERVVALMRAEGMTATVSSIHVNGWFGNFDKLAMTRVFAAERLGLDLESARERFVFVGDSPNDQPMFGFFPLSVGVANVADFRDRLDTPPAFVTKQRAGAGFVELTERLLAAR